MIAILLSFAAAFVLSLVSLPDWLTAYRPDWVALVLIYWCLALPQRIGAGAGWVAGLMVDVMNANLLGVHALGLALVGFLARRSYLRIRVFPWWQQALTVFLLLLAYRGLVGWVRSLVVDLEIDYRYWLPCVVGMIIWPLVAVILRDMRRDVAAK